MNKPPSKKQLQNFGLLIGFGFPVFIGWILPLITGHPFRIWTVPIGFIALTFGYVNPNLLHYPYKLWMQLGNILGWINSRIILGFIFIFILQPIALIMRIFGYDPLRKRHSNNNSYKEKREEFKIDLKRIF